MAPSTIRPATPTNKSATSIHLGNGLPVFNPQTDVKMIKEKTKRPKISKNSGRIVLNNDCIYVLYTVP